MNEFAGRTVGAVLGTTNLEQARRLPRRPEVRVYDPGLKVLMGRSARRALLAGEKTPGMCCGWLVSRGKWNSLRPPSALLNGAQGGESARSTWPNVPTEKRMHV